MFCPSYLGLLTLITSFSFIYGLKISSSSTYLPCHVYVYTCIRHFVGPQIPGGRGRFMRTVDG
jgi:hypothetical protein